MREPSDIEVDLFFFSGKNSTKIVIQSYVFYYMKSGGQWDIQGQGWYLALSSFKNEFNDFIKI